MRLAIADVAFNQVLQGSDSSSVFQVTAEGKLHVLKVVCC